MPTLKVVLHGEKTFEKISQKILSKTQKFVRKVSEAEFRYGQTIFLQFSLILLIILKLMVLQNFICKLQIQSTIEQLRWTFFMEMINVLYPLVLFIGELHRGCLTGF